MNDRAQVIDRRRVALFLAFAFGIAWALDLVIYLTGGLGQGGNRAFLLLLSTMLAPTLANVLTRLLTREGWSDLMLRPHLGRNWRLWLLAWVGTPLLVLLSTAIYLLIQPRYFDPSLSVVQQLLDRAAERAGMPLPLGPLAFVAIQIVQGILLSPLVNSLATLGEEFGWRGYLLPKLMPLGGRWAMVASGLIWGAWHWPAILMGYEYGLDYPGAPWLGPIVFLWFTFILGTFLGWMTLRAKTVWPATIGHAAINGMAAISVLFVQGQPNPLLGPLVVGVLGSIPFAALALLLLWRAPVLRRSTANP